MPRLDSCVYAPSHGDISLISCSMTLLNIVVENVSSRRNPSACSTSYVLVVTKPAKKVQGTSRVQNRIYLCLKFSVYFAHSDVQELSINKPCESSRQPERCCPTESKRSQWQTEWMDSADSKWVLGGEIPRLQNTSCQKQHINEKAHEH